MKDVINSTAEMLNGHITFGMVNVNDLKDLFVIYDIKSVPTIVIFEEGKPVERIEGYIPFTTLGNQLSKNKIMRQH
jgi:Thioredoxin.